jgi:hypothetical protein
MVKRNMIDMLMDLQKYTYVAFVNVVTSKKFKSNPQMRIPI